jgi:hypothetical protein
MIAGLCWKHHMSTLVKHEPHSLDNITYIGIRDLEDSERSRIVDAGAYCIFGGEEGIDYARLLRKRLESQGPDKRSLYTLISILSTHESVTQTIIPSQVDYSLMIFWVYLMLLPHVDLLP